MANVSEAANIASINELTEQEREQLLVVMRRAKEFEIEEEKSLLRQPLEGQLLKFTNVVKGYQFRWFVLNPEVGHLEYYEKEDHKRTQKPRGALQLMGATVSPSEEDSQTFFVYANNAEFFRLKAYDARERQYWVNRLRAVAEFHSENFSLLPHQDLSYTSGSSSSLQHVGGSAPTQSGLVSHGSHSTVKKLKRRLSLSKKNRSDSYSVDRVRAQNTYSTTPDNLSQKMFKRSSAKPTVESGISTSSGFDPLRDAKELIGELRRETDCFEDEIRAALRIDSSWVSQVLSGVGEISRLDKDLLLAKATSKATLSCLEECLRILRDQQSTAYQYPFSHAQDGLLSAMNGGFGPRVPPAPASAPVSSSESALNSGAVTQASEELKDFNEPNSVGSDSKAIRDGLPLPIAGMETSAVAVNHDEDESDAETPGCEQDSTGSLVEEHKSVILHLLSQLKLGMDLTKVVLPTFILEKRSLLELFADCMAHPDMFLRITDCRDAESRMLAVLEWYLTSFHAGRKVTSPRKRGSLAKKPYNPIIGETFHCSWKIPVYDDRGDNVTLYYTAEQVSHHPPVSAFHFECPQRKMTLDASIYTKSKFNGMSICAVMVGRLCIRLLEHADEEYVFTLPTAYARSILSVPWVELGDKVIINCPKTKYSSTVMFHTKPFYGGKLHQISGEVRDPNSQVVCKVAGEWNGVLEFEYPSKGISDKKFLDVTLLPIIRKRVRPLTSQFPHESRNLWQHVTRALKQGNLQLATEHKKQLEEQQRTSERYRKEHNIQFPSKYFERHDDTWIYRTNVTSGSSSTNGQSVTASSGSRTAEPSVIEQSSHASTLS